MPVGDIAMFERMKELALSGQAYERGDQAFARHASSGDILGLLAEIERLRAVERDLIGQCATLRKSLDQISRMRLMPDDKINRVTLHAAIEVAKLHFVNQQQAGEK